MFDKLAMSMFVGTPLEVELHVHLEGSIAPPILLALARSQPDGRLPRDEEGLRELYRFRDFAHWVSPRTRATLADLARDAARSSFMPPADAEALVAEIDAVPLPPPRVGATESTRDDHHPLRDVSGGSSLPGQ